MRIQGSTTVNPIMARIAEQLRGRLGVKITLDTQGGSSGGINAVGEGAAELGMSSRPISEADRARFVDRGLKSHVVAYDGVAVVVSTPVARGGVESLSRAQIADIFTGKVDNWKQVGGPDLPIFVYGKEPGRGTLAVFERYVFGQVNPLVSKPKNYAEVGGNEETRQKVESHGSAVGQLSAAWAEGREGLSVVAIRGEDGVAISPTAEDIRLRRYPMFRELLLITAGTPQGPAAEIVRFTLSAEGQGIVRELNYLPVRTGA